jgi:predicted NUDIX family NTP pyrophosphohydrolase
VSARSAGLLLHRRGADGVEVLIAHMGGPFWSRREAGAWSIPKGEYDDGEDPLAAALREFAEEIGPPPDGPTVALGEIRQAGGKRVTVFAREADYDAGDIRGGAFTMEWPPRSGRTASFPEVDRAEWTPVERARERLVRGQVAALDALLDRIGEGTARAG